MIDEPDVKDQSLPLPALERIDHVCLEFEAAWKTGEPPQIESVLGDTPEPERSALLREVLLLELDYRSQSGQRPAPAEYEARFPEHSELVADVFRRSRPRDSSGQRRPKEMLPRKDITLDEFIQTVGDSGLMSADEVRSFVDDLPPDKKPADARELAKEMVRQRKLTKFQAQAVYQRKTRGLVLGNYVVLDRIGRGGMGQVYKAEHKRLDRVVALKILPSAFKKSEEAIKRFQREAKAIARLAHPNIVTVYDADEAEGVHFFVMEYVQGSDLFALVRKRGPLSVPNAVDYILQAAEALEYAHDQGIVHRDIKPANLLLEPEGTVKVLDMGLARFDEPLGADEVAHETVRQEGLATASDDEGLTRSGELLGTLDYMPPEQASDSRQADHRADVYSLGCTLYYLLTGRTVYPGDTLLEKIWAHGEQPIPSLRDVRPDVPESLDGVFRRMIAKRPQERYQSMSEVIAELRGCLPTEEGPVEGSTPPAPVATESAETLGLQDASSTPAAPDSLASMALEEVDLDRSVQLPKIVVSPASDRARARTSKRPDRRFVIGGLVAGIAFLVIVLLAVVLRPPAPDEVEPEAEKREPVDLERLAAAEPDSEEGQEPRAPAPAAAVAPFDETEAKELQRRWAEHLGVTVDKTNSIGMKLVLIPPGEFNMGTSKREIEQITQQAKRERWTDKYAELIPSEGPQHRVKITRPFYLGKHEVTVGQFRRFVDAKGYQTHAETEGREKTWRATGFPRGEDHPVGIVTWNDADAFCRWLSAEEAKRYRLPTEAQWEYACRGGTTTRYAGGDEEESLRGLSNLADQSRGIPWNDGHPLTAPAGQFDPNAFGVHDMHGNVAEHCEDWFDERYYGESPLQDPKGPSLGSARVARGGFYHGGSYSDRCARRTFLAVRDAWPGTGFRVVCTLEEGREEEAETAGHAAEDNEPRRAGASADEGTAIESILSDGQSAQENDPQSAVAGLSDSPPRARELPDGPDDERAFSEWLSKSEYQQFWKSKGEQGFYAVEVEGKNADGKSLFRARFEAKPNGPGFAHFTFHGIVAAEYDRRTAEYRQKGFRELSVHTYVDASGVKRFSGTWVRSRGRDAP